MHLLCLRGCMLPCDERSDLPSVKDPQPLQLSRMQTSTMSSFTMIQQQQQWPAGISSMPASHTLLPWPTARTW